jgi:hypothetical protein
MQPKKSKMENRDDTRKLLPLMFLTAVLAGSKSGGYTAKQD